MTSCGRFAAGEVFTRDEHNPITCKGCLNWLDRRRELPGATPPSRSAAEARPPDMREEEDAHPLLVTTAEVKAMSPAARESAVMARRAGPARDAVCPACKRRLWDIQGEQPVAVQVDGVWWCSTCYEADAPATEEAWVAGIGAGGPWAPPALRPCCPDAGKGGCHGQPPGYCACPGCVRAEQRATRDVLEELGKLIAWSQERGRLVDEAEMLRAGVAFVVAVGRGRWFAWRRWWRFECEKRRGAELEAGVQGDLLRQTREVLGLTAVEEVSGAVVRLLGRLDNAGVQLEARERERDEALIQASRSAEKVHELEKALAAAEAREGQATDEVAKLEAILERAGVAE